MIRPKGQPYTREELKHWATHFKGNSDITNGILHLIAEVERLRAEIAELRRPGPDAGIS